MEELVRQAEAAGYVSLEQKKASGEKIKTGDKIYAVGMKKIMALFHIGQEPLENGMNILGAHIDSPRLDVKQNPLYEDTDLAYLDTHYYGGVKKYQWVALPLAIHGVAVKKDGTVVKVAVGEEEADPVVYITDLLIHLAGKQMQKKAAEVIEGENLDILIGSRPLKDLDDDKKKEAVKANVLNILKEKYDIEEEDFLSAELEIVPAGKARGLRSRQKHGGRLRPGRQGLRLYFFPGNDGDGKSGKNILLSAYGQRGDRQRRRDGNAVQIF